MLSVLLALSLFISVSQSSGSLKSINGDIKVSVSGIMTNFGDYNADRRVDIFVLNRQRSSSSASSSSNKKPVDSQLINAILMPSSTNSKAELENVLEFPVVDGQLIRNVVTGDFDGDSLMDLALASSAKREGPFKLHVYYHVREHKVAQQVNATFSRLPLVLDWNGDGILDLFGYDAATSQAFFLYGAKSRVFERHEMAAMSGRGNKYQPNTLFYSAYVDIDNDKRPELVQFVRNTQEKRDEFLVTSPTDNATQHSITLPQEITDAKNIVVGSPQFADFRFANQIQMLLPACLDAQCVNSRLYLYDAEQKKWTNVSLSWELGGNARWGFALTGQSQQQKQSKQQQTTDEEDDSQLRPPIDQLSLGDFNLDGRIDALLSVESKNQASGSPAVKRLALLENEKGGEKMRVRFYSHILSKAPLLHNFAMFDIGEDGILDILATFKTENAANITRASSSSSSSSSSSGSTSSHSRLSFLKHTLEEDNYFIKVMMLSGRCWPASDCRGDELPYGQFTPGSQVAYSTESVEGSQQQSCAPISTTSAYNPLQLPYALFGLGSTSNYIQDLSAMLLDHRKLREKTFNFIVPNTQMVIIPYPRDSPSSWRNQLFIKPFQNIKVIYVAITLVSTMILLAIVVGILHYLELRQDKLEKIQDAQKFPFHAT